MRVLFVKVTEHLLVQKFNSDFSYLMVFCCESSRNLHMLSAYINSTKKNRPIPVQVRPSAQNANPSTLSSR